MVGVSKTFTNQKKVLNNIYLSFFYGAKIGIIGLNGSGKSTLMKIIAGYRQEFPGRSGLLARLHGRLPGTGTQTRRCEDRARSGRRGLRLDRSPAEGVRGDQPETLRADGRRADGPTNRASGRTVRTDRPRERLGAGQRTGACDGRPALSRPGPVGQGTLGRRTPPRGACAACCCSSPTCCCWTSRPTTSTPSRSTGWSNTCNSIRAR